MRWHGTLHQNTEPHPTLGELLGVAHRTRFANDGNFHLTRIGHFVLDTRCDVVRKIFDFFVVNLVGTDDYAQLSTGLDSVSFTTPG